SCVLGLFTEHATTHTSPLSLHALFRSAIVIPEIGFDDVPMSPVIRDETVTKKNPKMIVRIAARTLPWVGCFGAATRKMARRTVSSEEQSSELLSQLNIVCHSLLEKKKD